MLGNLASFSLKDVKICFFLTFLYEERKDSVNINNVKVRLRFKWAIIRCVACPVFITYKYTNYQNVQIKSKKFSSGKQDKQECKHTFFMRKGAVR